MPLHEHDADQEGTYGIALGFRIVEEADKLFLAEAEIAPYVDAPEELGVTLVFHPLDGLNPAEVDDESDDWPSWALDLDDDLTRDSSEPMDRQFTAIVRQLRDLTTEQLRGYLAQAREF